MEENKQEEILNYHKYIKSKEWLNKSKKWIERSVCERCGSIHRLTCHHKHYNTLGFEQRWDIIVLCWKCHKKYHSILGERILTKDFEKKLIEVKKQLRPSRGKIRDFVLGY